MRNLRYNIMVCPNTRHPNSKNAALPLVVATDCSYTICDVGELLPQTG
jgi:hypothetical protein